VGPWRIEQPAGQGTYGVVYQARRAGHPGSEPVALKIASFPQDPRFAREVQLLSRIAHPSVPELKDRGWWQPPGGPLHPYLVMQWVEGLPLYEWARFERPSSRQVLRVLAQVAWALDATHAAAAVHRDVKGDNVLVGPDGQASLMDFGAGTWKGAPRLTHDGPMPPGTREYRSPKALRFHWEHRRNLNALYEVTPADDVYALGVTAYRLVTGVYPPPGTDPEGRLEKYPVARPTRLLPQSLNAWVVPELASLIERMLADEPQARGSARQVAEAAEEAATKAGSKADRPLMGPDPVRVSATPGPAPKPAAEPVQVRSKPPTLPSEHRSSRAVVTLGVLLAMAIVAVLCPSPAVEAPNALARAEQQDAGTEEDGGTLGLGEEARTAPVSASAQPNSRRGVALDMPRKPLPGQLRTDGKGVCPIRGYVAINGGCWIAMRDVQAPCGEAGYEWRGDCYYPAFETQRPPTSEPQ
jgi:serine/threonine protein kinase